jgi:putative transposase
MPPAGPPSRSLSLCRLEPSSTRPVWLGRGHEGDHHRSPQFTDCVRMVHFMRNALSLVPKAAQQMVGATIRTVFAQPDSEGAREQWRRVSESFRHRFPRLSELMDEAEEDVLSYAAFPQEHWQKIWSNNPLERVNKEVKRRTNVVGIFPTEGSVIRLVGSVLSEQHDEWQVSKRYFSLGSLARLERKEKLTEQPRLMAV